MRGSTVRQLSMLSAVTPDDLVPAEHPIRRVRPMVGVNGRVDNDHHLNEMGRQTTEPDYVGLPEFEFGLDLILDAVERLRTQRRPGKRAATGAR